MTYATPDAATQDVLSKDEQIVLAALEVIRDRGVDGLTHRAVAAKAGVSLGLTTYYFSSLEGILEEAFNYAMRRDVSDLSSWVKALQPGVDLAEELTSYVLNRVEHASDKVYVDFVLVLAAMRRPSLRAKAMEWANWMTELLGRYLSGAAAAAIAAAYDGALLRIAITGDLSRMGEMRSAFRRACGDERIWPSVVSELQGETTLNGG